MVKDTINEFQGSSAETGSSIISYLLRTMTPIIIGETKSAKKIKYGLPFLAVRNKQKRTLFNGILKRV